MLVTDEQFVARSLEGADNGGHQAEVSVRRHSSALLSKSPQCPVNQDVTKPAG
jgi:hypothetical protein